MLDRDVLVTWVETAQAATNISTKPVMEILNAQCLRIIVVSPTVMPSAEQVCYIRGQSSTYS